MDSTFCFCISGYSLFNSRFYFYYLYISVLAFHRYILLSTFVYQGPRLATTCSTFCTWTYLYIRLLVCASVSSPFTKRFYFLYIYISPNFQQQILLSLSVHQGTYFYFLYLCTKFFAFYQKILLNLYIHKQNLYIRVLAFQQHVLLSLSLHQGPRLPTADSTLSVHQGPRLSTADSPLSVCTLGSSPFNSRFYFLCMCTSVFAFQ